MHAWARYSVGREKELHQLDNRLDLVLGGRGQVCFVTGEAGFGKTSLATGLPGAPSNGTRTCSLSSVTVMPIRASAIHTCRSGKFFRMLMGDTDDRIAQGMTTEENAGRLAGFLGVSKRIVADVGPDLSISFWRA